MVELLSAVYPESRWKQEAFKRPGKTKQDHWKDISRIKELLEQVGHKLGVEQVCIDLIVCI